MEALGLENIFGEEDINNLFMDDTEETTTEETGGGASQEEEDPAGKEEHSDTTTTEVDPENLFGEEEEEEKPESVGSGKKEEQKGKGDSSTDDGGGTSPQNFYSSIANAMAEDGIFPNLDEETIKQATDPESFSDLIEKEVEARLDEGQKRVLRALENGVEPTDIRKYEGALNFLSRITDKQLTAEDEQGEQLRYNLIYQDYVNQGMSEEKAAKFAKRSIDDGTDVDEAKEALQNNKKHFQDKYNELLEDAQARAEEDKAERKKQAEELKDSILKDKNLLGDIEITQDMRKKAFDYISRPVYKDPETGQYLTAMQKFDREHHAEFIKLAGLVLTLTNEGKDFDSLTKGKVKKEVRKGISELQEKLRGNTKTSDGNLRMITSAKDDPESYIGSGFRLDI